MSSLKGEIWLAEVNSLLGCLLLGSVALAAGLIIWHTAFGYNPLTRVFEEQYAPLWQALGTEPRR